MQHPGRGRKCPGFAAGREREGLPGTHIGQVKDEDQGFAGRPIRCVGPERIRALVFPWARAGAQRRRPGWQGHLELPKAHLGSVVLGVHRPAARASHRTGRRGTERLAGVHEDAAAFCPDGLPRRRNRNPLVASSI